VSKERQRAREAREAERRRAVEQAARRRERQAVRAQLRTRLTPTLPRRRRRFGSLSTLALVQLTVGWLGLQAALWVVFPSYRTRFGLAVVTLGFLLVLVRTRKRPAR
jgi:hypothetical protein